MTLGNDIDVVAAAAAPLAPTRLHVEGLEVVNESLTNSGLREATLAEYVGVIWVEPVDVATAHHISSVMA